jgi:hypothetical protein
MIATDPHAWTSPRTADPSRRPGALIQPDPTRVDPVRSRAESPRGSRRRATASVASSARTDVRFGRGSPGPPGRYHPIGRGTNGGRQTRPIGRPFAAGESNDGPPWSTGTAGRCVSWCGADCDSSAPDETGPEDDSTRTGECRDFDRPGVLTPVRCRCYTIMTVRLASTNGCRSSP